MSSRAAAGRKRLQTPTDSSSSTSKTFVKNSCTVPAIHPSPEPYTQQDVDFRPGHNQLSPYPGYLPGSRQDNLPKFKKSVGQSPYLLPTVNRTFLRTSPISSGSNMFEDSVSPGLNDNFNRYPPSPQLSARTELQPSLQRTPLRPQVLPIPQPYEAEQGSYSPPTSQSMEPFRISRNPNNPYREISSSADHSPLSSVSGTPTATSLTSFQSDYTVNTEYTSPPASYAYLTPSPSSSTATVDNATLYQYRRDSSGSSPSSGRDSQASMGMNNSQYYGSSSSSQRGVSSDTASSFVFPSSRSRAVPSSPPRFRFKSKKRKDKERAVVEPQLGPAGPSILVGGDAHPPSSFPVPGASISFAEPLSPSPKITSPASSTRSPARTTSSEDSQGFVFPSSRSRAHPDPSKKMKNPKVSSPTDNSPTSPSRFMGIPLKREKKPNDVAPTILEEPSEPFSSNHIYPDPIDPEPVHPAELQSRLGLLSMSSHENRTAVIQRCTKIGTYPLDPYDSTLLECDRQTGELLHRLNGSGTPSFYPYGTNPPSMILDLGCGQGHWMLDAAITWKGYGTRVTGVDMVDIGKNLRGLATKHGVADNVSFVKTNFVNKQLPFPDETFDMVRMSCLTFAMPFDEWHNVLQEVCRVLTVGGRLELIDDHFFFAYGKAPLSVPLSPSECSPPQLDIPIPSPRMSAIGPPPSIHATTVAHRSPKILGGDDDSGLYESDDAGPSTSMRHGNDTHLSTQSPVPSSVGTLSLIQSLYPDSWAQSAGSSKELESLFEHMLNIRYGIHLCPSEFLVEMMQQIFGHAREMETMHLTLAPPYEPQSNPDSSPRLPDSRPTALSLKDDLDPLLDSPGLVLWPSMFLPMPRQEVEAHALKHNKVLLSTKLVLVDYVLEISDEDDADEEGIKEALWEYENFMQQRFNPPTDVGTRGDSPVADDDIDRATIGANSNADRASVFSMSSVTTEGRAAMLEYQSDLRHRFGWATGEPSPTNSSASHQTARPIATDMGAVTPQLERSPTIKSMPPSFQSRRESRLSATTSMANPPPTYSRFEPAHIRTFHVYEAFKLEKNSNGKGAH